MIVHKQGIGNDLVEGVTRASKSVSKTVYYVSHVKGFKVPAQDPRAHKSVGLT